MLAWMREHLLTATVLMLLFACGGTVGASPMNGSETAKHAPVIGPPDNPISPENLRRLVPGLSPEEAARLSREGTVSVEFSHTVTTRLAPTFQGVSEISRELGRMPVSAGMEMLYVARVPESFRIKANFWRRIYNITRSVSTIRGLAYTPPGNSPPKRLYADAFVIPSPNDPAERMPDPRVESIPAYSRIFGFYRDIGFGDYVLSLTYRLGPGTNDPDYLRVSFKNMTSINFMVFPIIQPQDLRMDIVIVPRNGVFLFYGNFATRTSTFFDVRNQVESAFAERVGALFQWFMFHVRTDE